MYNGRKFEPEKSFMKMAMNQSCYTGSERMRDIIGGSGDFLTAVSRFSMSLGFGDKTVAEVCDDNGVDTATFLAVINLTSGKEWSCDRISPASLIAFLRKSNRQTLEYVLPALRDMLFGGIPRTESPDVAVEILRHFDRYAREILDYLEYEEKVLFPYVESMLAGEVKDKSALSDYFSRHGRMVGALDELEDYFIYHYDQKNNELMPIILSHIEMCSRDLLNHCEIENKLLLPALARLEENLCCGASARCAGNALGRGADKASLLTDREKDVITGIAQGLSNRHIAERLNLSFHTITTYRKNISAKLNIHSIAGLTIFACRHNLVQAGDAPQPGYSP